MLALMMFLSTELLVAWLEKRAAKKDDTVIDSRSAELPESMWSLVTLCALKQTQRKGVDVPQWLAVMLVLPMACLQGCVLYLIMLTLNPDAPPVTVHPSTPWNREPWTVNWMKWLMTFVLAVFLSSDAGQCKMIMREIISGDLGRISIRSKTVAGFLCTIHFLVILCTVYVGGCAVLSLQAVPDILYSALAITFIAHVDDMAWEFMRNLLGLDANFTIVHEAGDASVVGHRLEVFLRAMSLFPVMLAVYVTGVGFYTDVMPNKFIHL
jgi:hypothetical protein